MIAAEFPPAEAWAEFILMRKSIKKPMTAYAAQLMLKRLAAFVANGQDAQAMLEQSIMNCWQTVYEVKIEQAEAPRFNGTPRLALVDQNRANNEAACRLLDHPGYDEGRTIDECR